MSSLGGSGSAVGRIVAFRFALKFRHGFVDPNSRNVPGDATLFAHIGRIGHPPASVLNHRLLSNHT
jgi:hypothetical protein